MESKDYFVIFANWAWEDLKFYGQLYTPGVLRIMSIFHDSNTELNGSLGFFAVFPVALFTHVLNCVNLKSKAFSFSSKIGLSN